jgi:hypothetical protein
MLLLFSCKREKEKFVVNGVLYKDCEKKIPYVNYPLILEYFTQSIREDPFELPLTTNDKGEFSGTYETVSDLINGNLSISFVAGYANTSLVSDLPLNKSVNLGNIVKGINSYVIYKIGTKKPYSNTDTLFYGITASNFIPPYKMEAPYVIGPFKDGQIIDTIVRSSLMVYSNASQTVKTPVYNEWRLGSSYFDRERKNHQGFELNPCKVYEEVVIDLSKSIK